MRFPPSPGGPQACSGAAGAAGHDGLHLDAVGRRLRPEPPLRPGPDRHRRDHRHRRVRAVLQRRHRRLRGLLRPEHPCPHGRGRRVAQRTGLGIRRGGPRHRDGRGQRPLRLHRRLRGAERDRATGPPWTSTTGSPATTWPRWSPPVGVSASRTTPRVAALAGERHLRADGRAGADHGGRLGRLGIRGLLRRSDPADRTGGRRPGQPARRVERAAAPR